MQLCFQSLKRQISEFSANRKFSIENLKRCGKTAEHQLSRIKSLVKALAKKVYFYQSKNLGHDEFGLIKYCAY